MQHRLLTKGLALAAGLLLAATTITPAAAVPDPHPLTLRYTALGDSYAAGLGAGDLIDAASGRFSQAYPVQLVGKAYKVNFLAESGAKIADVIDQAEHVPATTRRITLTVGGNDVGFGEIALACADGPESCAAALAVPRPTPDQVGGSLALLMMALSERAPKATIYVTGYPVLFEVSAMSGCATLDSTLWLSAGQVDQATRALNELIQVVALSNGGVFVDVEDDFAGQGLCNPLSTLLNPPMPDLSFPTGFNPASLHPTAAGQAAYAAAIMAAGFDS